MSFQHFRLGQLAMSQPLPPHLQQHQHPPYVHPTTTKPSSSTTRPPYGSGDTDDGYTLVFPTLAAFQDWRTREEDTQMVEFVKGDTHGSKAVPPRFKDHTKLVCARHSRSGRKKYVKKHPDRVRKVPSRKVSLLLSSTRATTSAHARACNMYEKLEGQGCQASISYKTYYDTEDIRVCCTSPSLSAAYTTPTAVCTDVAEHSHPIGLANLPFTRRGRRAAVEAEKAKTKRNAQAVVPVPTEASTSSSAAVATQTPQPHVAPFSSTAPLTHLPHPFPHYPGQPGVGAPYPQMVPTPPAQNEQWERMSVLFNSIREHARAYEYPAPSVVALESVLIRLYLESPMGMMGGPGLGPLGAGMHGIIPPPQQQQGQASQPHDSHPQTTMGVTSSSGDHANSEMDSSIESG